MTMLTEKVERRSFIDTIFGLQFISTLRLGNYRETNFYFRHGEYHVIVDHGKTTTKAEGTGRIYKFIVQAYAAIRNRLYYFDWGV